MNWFLDLFSVSLKGVVMWQLLVVFIFSNVLVGCAHPLANVSGLSEKNLGQVVSFLYGDDVKLKEDETEKLKHWRFDGGRIYADEKFANAGLARRLGYFDKYCSSLGGVLSAPVTYQNTRVKEVACNQEKSNAAIFRVFAANVYCHLNTVSDSGYDKDFPYSCRVWLDAFQWKSMGRNEDLEIEYGLQSEIEGFKTIQVVNDVKQREHAESLKRVAAFKAEFERQWQLKKDEERRLKDSASTSSATGGCPSIRQDQVQRMERFISDFESVCRATRGRVVHGDLQFQCNLPHGTSYAIFFRIR